MNGDGKDSSLSSSWCTTRGVTTSAWGWRELRKGIIVGIERLIFNSNEGIVINLDGNVITFSILILLAYFLYLVRLDETLKHFEICSPVHIVTIFPVVDNLQ